MKVTVENVGPCRKKMKVEVPAEQVSEEYGNVLKAYVKQARISGFRPGKAPKNLVENKFAKDIQQEVKDRLVPQGYHEALKQEKLDPIAVLGVEDVILETGKPLTFSVSLDVPPEFKLPTYAGIKVKGEKIDVTDDEVKQMKGQMLDQYARWEDVTDRSVQRGDLVQIDYKGTCDGQAIETFAPKAAGLGKGADFWMMTDENAFLPALADGLVGMGVGEKKEIPIDFPDDFSDSDLAGKKCLYSVEVKAVREKKMPELNEELLKSFQVDSEEALEKRIRDDLRKMKEDREKQRRKNELVKTLLGKTKIDVPESVVMQETRDAVYEMVRQQGYRGVGRDEIEQKRDEIFAVANQNATEKVKAQYILHRIAEEEKIEVSDDEVSERIKALAAHYQVTPEEFRAEMTKRNSLETVQEEIRLAKTTDFLLEKAVIKE